MLCFIKVIVLAPSSVWFSTTATYLSTCFFTYFCVPCYCHACYKPFYVPRATKFWRKMAPTYLATTRQEIEVESEPDWRVGGSGKFLLEDPYDVIHDVIVCRSYVFSDTQGSRSFFSVGRERAFSNAHTVSCEK